LKSTESIIDKNEITEVSSSSIKDKKFSRCDSISLSLSSSGGTSISSVLTGSEFIS
jgi:hypothetical protein